MNPQKPIRSRFVPLAPPALPTRHDRFLPLLPGVTKVIPPADETSETTIDPRLKTVMKRLMPFEAVLAQCVTASPNSGRILLEDPLLALSKAQVALYRLSQQRADLLRRSAAGLAQGPSRSACQPCG
jgi:hypothetical protein